MAPGLLGILAVAGPQAVRAKFVHGSASAGDSFFPHAGNGGYQVSHYDLRLRYGPRSNRLRAAVRIMARAGKGLSRFDLDFRGPPITSLRVDRAPARFRRDGQELVITPRRGIKKGRRFTVKVRYRGKPHPVIDPDGSLDGWIPTKDGAFVANEPQGAPTWFPCDDSLTDKATYRFRVTVPKGTTAVANGALVHRAHHHGHTTFLWRERAPMATYLATVTTGRFRTRASHADGIPSYVAMDPVAGTDTALQNIGGILRLFTGKFGRYPFGQTGAIVDHAPFVGYALETQTRPLFDRSTDPITLAHELAHQWFGDSVTLRRWRDMWLNEGFATWSQWYWDEQVGGPTTQHRFNDLYAAHGADDKDFWNPPPGNPGSPKELFARSLYGRGGMTLEALRERVGNATFFKILRDWARAHRYGNATIKQFIALSEGVSGDDLGPLFQAWLYQPGKPTSW